MKKLLVILLLLFPVHGAWAKDFEFFGIKIGDKIQKYKSKYELKIICDKPCEDLQLNTDIKLSSKNVPKKNKHFDTYNVRVTPETNLVFEIDAIGNFLEKGEIKKDRNFKCESVVNDIMDKIENKYLVKFDKTPIPAAVSGKSYTAYAEEAEYFIYVSCYAASLESKKCPHLACYTKISFHFVDKELRKKYIEESSKIEKRRHEKDMKKIKENVDTSGFD